MRRDRDGFVKILLQNVQPGAQKNFQAKSSDTYSMHRTPFDYESVMQQAVLKLGICSCLVEQGLLEVTFFANSGQHGPP